MFTTVLPLMANPTEVTPQEDYKTSQIFQVRGQSDFYYPDRRITPEHAELLSNVNITERGTVRKKFGYDYYNSAQMTDAEAGTGFRQVKFASGTSKNIETALTKIYTDDGTTRAAITPAAPPSVGGADDRYIFEFIKDQVVMTNGADPTYTYNGSGVATALGGVLWTTCQSLVTHKNLLIALGPTESGTYNPTMIRWPDVKQGTLGIDITVWPTDSKFEVQEGGAKILTGVDAYDFLAVVKEDGVHLVTFDLEEGFIEAFPNRALTGAFSPVARNGALYHPDFGIWVIAEDGAYVISPDLSFDLVTAGIQNEWNNNLNDSRIQYAQSYIRLKDHQVRTLMSSTTNTSGHDKMLVWDWSNGDVWFDSPDDVLSTATSFRVSNAEFDVYGTSDGYYLKGNDSSKISDISADIDWKITMSPNDLGSPGVDKTIHAVVTHYVTKEGSQTIAFIGYLNEGRISAVTENLVTGTAFKWDTGLTWNSGMRWPGEGSNIARTFINRTAQTVAPQWAGTEDFELKGYQVVYSLAE